MSIEDLSGAAPADYPVKFEQKLRDRILSNTRLTELKEDGDITFYPTIKKYETDELAPDENNQTTLNRLIVSMEVAYVDKNDPKSNWKKSFNAPNDATFSTTENLSNVESGLLEDVIDPVLIQQIFDEAIAEIKELEEEMYVVNALPTEIMMG